ncbi:uncharacterized protein [Amphiura filiformis]|uniref:uncharacterized protein n=1 Tax=Amphiura filiformis TaxID=82378 RepID=UPI003B210D26
MIFQYYLLPSLLLVQVRSNAIIVNGDYTCDCRCDCSRNESDNTAGVFTPSEYFQTPDCSTTILPTCNYHIPIDIPCKNDWRCCMSESLKSCRNQNLTIDIGKCNGTSPDCYEYHVDCDCEETSKTTVNLLTKILSKYGAVIGAVIGISLALIIAVHAFFACKHHNKATETTQVRDTRVSTLSTDSEDYVEIDANLPTRPKYPSVIKHTSVDSSSFEYDYTDCRSPEYNGNTFPLSSSEKYANQAVLNQRLATIN